MGVGVGVAVGVGVTGVGVGVGGPGVGLGVGVGVVGTQGPLKTTFPLPLVKIGTLEPQTGIESPSGTLSVCGLPKQSV
ncbi:MAG: hypothetical protein CBB70_15765 [Planctomycetaceae bacterium TMED10]|nr:MAG: hypothetical protein CBB70_15765 [Planctomycetaceae bacterium TMED10]